MVSNEADELKTFINTNSIPEIKSKNFRKRLLYK